MARIAGVNIPNHQHTEIALQAIYGIGSARARAICAAASIKNDAKIKDLSESDMDRLREQVARLCGRGRPAPRSLDEHQAVDGSGLLPRTAAPQRAAGAGPAHEDQCAHAQGPAQGRY